MTSIMRRTVRGAATGLGALALVAGASACGSLLGGDDEGGEDPATGEEQPAEEDGGDAASDAGEDSTAEDGASDGGGDAAAEPIDEAGLTTAGDRFLEFLQTVDDDTEKACGYFLDPSTAEPLSGDQIAVCGEELESSMGDSVQPGMFDMVDRSMVAAEDNGDGTVRVLLDGDEFPFSMQQGSDGQWYLAMA